MINKQLVDFIREQLKENLTKELISKELLANGWTKEDIEEGFSAANIQTFSTPPSAQPITLNSNPNIISNTVTFSDLNSFSSLNPSLNSRTTTNISAKPQKHLGKKVFFIFLILFLLAGGISAYYFRNTLINLPILKNVLRYKDTIINQIPAVDNNQEKILPTETTEAVAQPTDSNVVRDCGLSDQSKIQKLVYEKKDKDQIKSIFKTDDLDKDNSLVCMGRALLSNCQKAIVKIQSKNGTIHTEEITSGDDKECTLKISYGEVNKADVSEKELANSYLQCEYSNTVLKNISGCSPFFDEDTCNFFGIKDSPAHIYANSVISMIMAVTLEPKDIVCSGSMVNKILKNSKSSSPTN